MRLRSVNDHTLRLTPNRGTVSLRPVLNTAALQTYLADAEAARDETQAIRDGIIGDLGTTDSQTATLVNGPSLTSAAIGAQLDTEVPPLVAASIAADSTPAAAAAAAVDTALALESVLVTRIYSNDLADETMTTQAGTPNYTGGSLSGGTLKLAAVSDSLTPIIDSSGATPLMSGGCVEALVTLGSAPAADRVMVALAGTFELRAQVTTGNLKLAHVRSDTHASQNLVADIGTYLGDGQVHHCCVEWEGSVANLYLDGELVIAAVQSSEFAPGTPDFYIGGWHGVATNNWYQTASSAVHAVRVTEGVRYGGEFTPPTDLSADAFTLIYAGLDNATAQTANGSQGWPARGDAPMVRWLSDVDAPTPPGAWLADEWIKVAGL